MLSGSSSVTVFSLLGAWGGSLATTDVGTFPGPETAPKLEPRKRPLILIYLE